MESLIKKIPPFFRMTKMNKTEKRYAQNLELRRKAGEITRYSFETLKFILAKNTSYTPDFLVITPECIELHEVKGWWREDARVKIKVAAQMFPEFRWIAIQWKNEGWVYEEF